MLDTRTAELIEVPLDEGAIDCGLAELDNALAAWINAAKKFQVNLATRAQTAERSEQRDDSKPEGQAAPHGTAGSVGGEGSTEKNACEGAHARLIANTRVDEEASVVDGSSELSRLRMLFEKRSEPVRDEAEQVNDVIHDVESETENQQERQPSSSTEVDSNEAGSELPTAEEEENILLASLDPKTRRDIHVLRRISDERKNIHQLLEEYRAAQARQNEAQDKEPGNRSWWRLSR
jgi:hypothetical protein